MYESRFEAKLARVRQGKEAEAVPGHNPESQGQHL